VTAILQAFLRTRRTTEALTAALTAEDCQIQAMPDVSPAKWHLAHTSWFFEQFVLGHAFDPRFAHLFNSYYEAVGAEEGGIFPRPQRGLITRPDLETVRRYRTHVTTAMQALLESGASAEALRLTELGIHHEQQHQELLLTDLKYNFSVNPLQPAYHEGARTASRAGAPAQNWAEFPAGIRLVGHDGEGFAFDNEGPRHRVFLEDFALMTRLVTNGEFLAFIADGGYERPELWLSDGWQAAKTRGWRAPLYWERKGDEWWHFTLEGPLPVVLDEPVCHVSYFEAQAFAAWAGARLPTECEWEVAAKEHEVAGNFLDDGILAPRRAGDSPQFFGDCWEWTQSAYLPYPRYQPAPGAVGEYNGKFMSGQMVLRGGSCATPAGHVRPTYRNFFPPDVRWQFSGVRLARTL
jgi:ergothioneine biosynthesis protein EgtB